MSTRNGRFVWYDLVTTEPARAKHFYGALVGWRTKRWGGGDYEMWQVGDMMIGGIQPPSEEARGRGRDAPGAFWLGYVSMQNVDEAMRRAEALGGRVLETARQIPSSGRFAVVADPRGARFAVFRSDHPTEGVGRHAFGNFGWAELNTDDWRAAWPFYAELCGWTETRTVDLGEELGAYRMFAAASAPEDALGGMWNAAKALKAPPRWVYYLNVTSIDETARRIVAEGGQVVHGPMEVPGGDRVAQCVDPVGAHFGIFSAGAK